jgi:antitoxin (DNA-binding transcriptional repressor) of toxin-antitoxin stability system
MGEMTMKAYAVGEFKNKFSDILEFVKHGEEIEILYGRSKKPIARIIPIPQPPHKRKVGFLQGQVSVSMSDDFEMTPEELLAI